MRSESYAFDLLVQKIGDVFCSQGLDDFAINFHELVVVGIVEASDALGMAAIVNRGLHLIGGDVGRRAGPPHGGKPEFDLVYDISQGIGFPEASWIGCFAACGSL